MDADTPAPHQRATLIGREDVERRLRAAMRERALSHGWIIAGPSGSGKATLAYRIARGLLEPSALCNEDTFEVSPDARTFHLIAAGAHPDLFVAQRAWDEKKSKYQSEITVETVRKLTTFLNRTASGGGWRVAIVDTADDMNRNAANALLKALEEPPAKTLLMLLSSAPGRLLATIRSRCRRIDLPPVLDAAVEAFLISEGVKADAAKTAASAARGRPGYALQLAAGDGVDAVNLSRQFLKTVAAQGDVSKFASMLSGKAGDARWEIFKDALVNALSDAARAAATGEKGAHFAPAASPAALTAAWEEASRLIAQGEGLNLDRGQLVFALAYDLRDALGGRAA